MVRILPDISRPAAAAALRFGRPFGARHVVNRPHSFGSDSRAAWRAAAQPQTGSRR